ncbi:HEAT repeat domain-containing protein [Polyangium spumosum]|uniref:HEAT repeat domain-containing protein n=1 Tax=Polyangium spumosum TaxID=889282 RepID=A0A6N7QCD1_9BACT|nr:hypothetical protein [Polyangium spumosum]MRG98541.1 hypothetical protein [Polyangium spumosum]
MVSLPASPLVKTVLGPLGGDPPAPRIAMAFATWTLARDPDVAREAAEITDRCVRGLSLLDVLWLERHRREDLPFTPRGDAWRALQPADVTRFEAFGDAETALLCVLTAHPNGHVRQASIERLSLRRDGVEVPFLLARLNDWVRPVRAAAKLTVRAWIAEAQKGDLARGRALLGSLPLFDRLRELGRDDHAPICAAIEALLEHPAFALVLDEGLDAPRRDVRFRCFMKALERPEADARRLLTRALADRDASIRLWAARAAPKRLAGDELRAVAETMRRDVSAPVRNEATFVLATKIEPPDRDALEQALLDPSASVRWTARHYLAERWKFDARATYLRALDAIDPSILAAAIAGLAECSSHADDAAHALALLDHRSAAVRKAALVALDRWAGAAHVKELFAALGDERPSVAREATGCLKKHVHHVELTWIQELLRNAPRSHTRRMALRLAMYRDPRRHLDLLLEAMQDPDAAIVEEAKRSIQSWVGWARWTRPVFAPEEPERLEDAVERVRAALGDTLANTLVEILRSASR